MRDGLLIQLSLHQTYLAYKRVGTAIQCVDLCGTAYAQIMSTNEYQQILWLFLANCACLILLHRYSYYSNQIFQKKQTKNPNPSLQPNPTKKTNPKSHIACPHVQTIYRKVGNWFIIYIFKIGMTDSMEVDGLKEYINELFTQYDTEHKGKLNFQQISKFFEDLLKSCGVDLVYTLQQLYEVIYMAKPGFNGQATPDDIYTIFQTFLTYRKKPIETTPQQPNYINYQQYPQMQNQFVNQGYNSYMPMQGQQPQYTAYNPYTGQSGYNGFNTPNGHVWTYPGYMGVNPYGYRQ